MSKLAQHSKYFQHVYTKVQYLFWDCCIKQERRVFPINNLNSPLIHTSRNSGIPNLAREENSSEPDYLQCLRPAKLNVADTSYSDLAGQPRSADRFEGIRPEIFEKWNQRPKIDRIKEWNKLPLFN